MLTGAEVVGAHRGRAWEPPGTAIETDQRSAFAT